MSITTDQIPSHMSHLLSFTTCLNGKEFTVYMDYFPAVDDDEGKFPHSANVEYALYNGADFSEELKESVLEIFVERFLHEMDEANYGD